MQATKSERNVKQHKNKTRGQVVADNLERILADKEWTIYRLSKQCKVSLTALYSLPVKGRGPTADLLIKIADALGVTVDELVR